MTHKTIYLCLSLLGTLLGSSTLTYSVIRPTKVPPKPVKQTVKPVPNPKPGETPKPAGDLGTQAVQWWDNFLKNPNISWKCAALEFAQILKKANKNQLAAALETTSTQTDALKVAQDLRKFKAQFPDKLKQHLKPYESDFGKLAQLVALFEARVKIRTTQCPNIQPVKQTAKPTPTPKVGEAPKPAGDLGTQAVQWWDNFLKNPKKSWKCAALEFAQILKKANKNQLATALEASSTYTNPYQLAGYLEQHKASFPEKLKQHLKPYQDPKKISQLLALFEARVKLHNAKC